MTDGLVSSTEHRPDSEQPTQLAPATPSLPEIYERSPTLLAGPIAGMHGEVRVWSPQKQNLRLGVAYIFGGFLLSIILCYFLFHGDVGFSIGTGIGLLILQLVPYWMASKRPCYLTTDDNGIGVTTWEGSRSFRWIDIHAIKWAEGSLFSIEVTGKQAGEKPEQVILNLAGYQESVKREFLSLVMTKAQLQPYKKSILSLYPGGSRTVEAPPSLPTPTSNT